MTSPTALNDPAPTQTADDIRSTAGGPVTARPHSHGGERTGSPAERLMSWDPAAFADPSVRDEEWKFAPLRRIRTMLAGAPSDAHLVWTTQLPDGVRLEQVPADDELLVGSPAPVDRLGALSAQLAGDAMVVRVDAGVELGAPVVLKLTGSGADLVWGRLLIDIGAGAKAVVVIEYSGDARYGAHTAVRVGDGAGLTLVHVQNWDDAALHNEHIAASLGRDADYRLVSISLGGGVVRITPTVRFDAPGASAELVGLSYAGAGQHQESRLYVDHSVPDCRSNVLYKTALQGATSRTVWVGDVRIRPAATGTTTYELNRNLLLSDGARADSVPNLEIETGEIVSAGHASATGRFDDLQLFYLQSRGIPELEARKLVVRGFFTEILDYIPVPELHDRLLAEVESRLAG
jgi:Fe-S cluster assembly protein SufD